MSNPAETFSLNLTFSKLAWQRWEGGEIEKEGREKVREGMERGKGKEGRARRGKKGRERGKWMKGRRRERG